MRLALRVKELLALLLGASALGAGCLGGPSDPTGTTTNHVPPQTVTVTVTAIPTASPGRTIAFRAVDRDELPIVGATVVVSVGAAVLDEETTDSDGLAPITVVDGAFVTAHLRLANGFVMSQSAVVVPGDSTLELKFVYLYVEANDWPTIDAVVTVNGFPSGTGVIAYDDKFGNCSAALTSGGPMSLSVPVPFCLQQRNGRFYSIWGYTQDPTTGMLEYGFTHDLAYSTTAVTLDLQPEVPAHASTTFFNEPSNEGSPHFIFAPIWSGRRVGPEAFSTSSGTLDVIGTEGADSIEKFMYFEPPSESDDEVFENVLTPASDVDWTIDGSALIPPISSPAVFSTDGTIGLTWTIASSGSADTTYAVIQWQGHRWTLDLPPGSGVQHVVFPPLPSSFGTMAVSAQTGVLIEYRDLDFILGYPASRSPSGQQHFQELASAWRANIYQGGFVDLVPDP